MLQSAFIGVLGHACSNMLSSGCLTCMAFYIVSTSTAAAHGLLLTSIGPDIMLLSLCYTADRIVCGLQASGPAVAAAVAGGAGSCVRGTCSKAQVGAGADQPAVHCPGVRTDRLLCSDRYTAERTNLCSPITCDLQFSLARRQTCLPCVRKVLQLIVYKVHLKMSARWRALLLPPLFLLLLLLLCARLVLPVIMT